MATRESSSNAACNTLEEDLVLFHYNELDASASENIISHLKSCASCRESKSPSLLHRAIVFVFASRAERSCERL